MGNSVLPALDNFEGELKAVKYVAENLNRDAKLTLFSALPEATDACGLDDASLIPLFQRNMKTFCTIKEAKKRLCGGKTAPMGPRASPVS